MKLIQFVENKKIQKNFANEIKGIKYLNIYLKF